MTKVHINNIILLERSCHYHYNQYTRPNDNQECEFPDRIQETRCLEKCLYSCLSELKPTAYGLQLEYLSRIPDLTSAQN